MVIIPGWAATQLPHKLFHKLGNNNKTRVCFVKTGCKVEERLRFALKEKVEKCKNTIWKGRYNLGKNPNIPNPRIFPSAKNCFSPDKALRHSTYWLGGWTIKNTPNCLGDPISLQIYKIRILPRPRWDRNEQWMKFLWKSGFCFIWLMVELCRFVDQNDSSRSEFCTPIFRINSI